MKFWLYLFVLLFFVNSVSAISGTTTLLTVINENASLGGTASVKLEILPGSGRVFFDSYPLSQIDTQISARYAKEIACNFLELDCSELDFFYTIRSSSSVVGGPSAGGPFTVLTVALLDGQKMNSDVAMTGTINSGGSIGTVGGVEAKISAAEAKGIKKILVPLFSSKNATFHSSEVIEVFKLTDALYHFTGKNYSQNYALKENPGYEVLMKKVAEDLCKATDEFFKLALDNESYEYNVSLKYKNLSVSTSEQRDYYSTASFCFSANIRLRKLVLDAFDDNLKLIDLSDNLKEQISSFEQKLAVKELKKLSELETYMIVKERLDESKTMIVDLDYSNISTAELAYAMERYNSAVTWASFFDLDGRAIDLNLDYLESACESKLSEVEERKNLLRVLLPDYENAESENAKETALSKDYGLCLFQATKAKAEINALIGVVAVNSSDIEPLIDRRLELAESAIAKSQARGDFPILAFSYFNYAKELKGEDNVNSLIFSEYALEFSDLSIYFPQKLKKAVIPVENDQKWQYLIFGFIIGCIFTLLLLLLIANIKKPGRNPHKKASPRKKR